MTAIARWLQRTKPQPEEWRGRDGELPEMGGGYKGYLDALQAWNEAREAAGLTETFEAKTHQDSLQNAPAPVAVAGGDAPEIQVGDWVALNTRYETDSTYILSGLNRVSSEVEVGNFNQRGHWYKPLPGDQPKPDVSEIRGERDGQPFIWRRRQEGQ